MNSQLEFNLWVDDETMAFDLMRTTINIIMTEQRRMRNGERGGDDLE